MSCLSLIVVDLNALYVWHLQLVLYLLILNFWTQVAFVSSTLKDVVLAGTQVLPVDTFFCLMLALPFLEFMASQPTPTPNIPSPEIRVFAALSRKPMVNQPLLGHISGRGHVISNFPQLLFFGGNREPK